MGSIILWRRCSKPTVFGEITGTDAAIVVEESYWTTSSGIIFYAYNIIIIMFSNPWHMMLLHREVTVLSL
jgi:hypothetical protein